jgi:hypothetical protein|tara:strand:+ start:333 stop:530 length:198 start_codon:yes stop_codon:yes gene_type:complete
MINANKPYAVKMNLKISCTYNNKKRVGVLEQMKTIPGKGVLCTVKTQDGYRGMYMEKMTDYKKLD